MTTKEMIARLEAAIDDIGAVIQDLKDVDGGEIEMGEVNDAYAREAVARTNGVIDEIKAAA